VTLSGGEAFYLWPGQSALVYLQANAWRTLRSKRWAHPGGFVDFYTNPAAGSDVVGATDGLVPGAAFQTVQQALHFAIDQIEFNSSQANTRVRINMAAAQNDTVGIHLALHDALGAQGGAAILVRGAVQAVTGAANNGAGAIRLTVPSTALYSSGQVVCVYGVQGTTEANGGWPLTVVDATHVDLQGSTFSNGFTSPGLITLGSGFNCAAQDCIETYFSTVIQFANCYFTSSTNRTCVTANWGAKVYILDGCVFGAVGTGNHLYASGGGSQIEIDNLYGIAGPAGCHYAASDHGTIRIFGDPHIAFDGSFTTATALAGQLALVRLFTAFRLHGHTIAGTRWLASANGVVNSMSGSPNTEFPGNVNGSASTGGQGI
jgi:hypothetical protein